MNIKNAMLSVSLQCVIFFSSVLWIEKQTNQLLIFFYEEHKIPCECLYKRFLFFYEEHKIPCECLCKCFIFFMRSIKYLANVYKYKCFFFLFHSFAEFGTNQSGLLTSDDDVGLNVLS